MSAPALADSFGTPLHVISGTRLRANYRRIRDAFAACWEPGVNVYFAIKSNPALALRRALAQEGAGGDCLGVPELQASLIAGTRPERLVLNGNNKAGDALELAVRCGVSVNVDDLEEIDRLAAIAREAGRPVTVGIRVKPARGRLEERGSQMMPVSVGAYAEKSKWGLEPGDAVTAARAIARHPELQLRGIHYHLGRHLAEVDLFAEMAPGLAALFERLRAEAGWTSRSLTIGGGFTQGRDPFFRNSGGEPWPRATDCFVAPIEDFAQAMCSALRRALAERDLPQPVLGLEPGRYITASAGVTLTRVGTVKRGSDRTWVMVDACGTHLGLSRSPHDAHAVVVADGSGSEREEPCDVVGPLCVLDVIVDSGPLPPVARDALLAVLDTGGYADGEASNANSIGRPAVVLVEGSRADLIRRRETFADVFSRDTVPAHLAGPDPASPWHDVP